jgi:4a-hydroxytetrahydrobiopterin dehydratase
MSTLASKKCTACERGTPPINEKGQQNLLKQLQDGWRIVDGHHLQRTYRFDDFKSALDFTNRVGELAEEEGHHPNIELSYGKVGITLWTHAANGLTENDFILAAKIDDNG